MLKKAVKLCFLTLILCGLAITVINLIPPAFGWVYYGTETDIGGGETNCIGQPSNCVIVIESRPPIQ